MLAKSSSSPFSSTTLDYLFRNMGIRTLIVMGLLTDQCRAALMDVAAFEEVLVRYPSTTS
jgi:nicotinamidase-related amidase